MLRAPRSGSPRWLSPLCAGEMMEVGARDDTARGAAVFVRRAVKRSYGAGGRYRYPAKSAVERGRVWSPGRIVGAFLMPLGLVPGFDSVNQIMAC